MGGSICLQLLTRSGWSPSNEIEVWSSSISKLFVVHIFHNEGFEFKAVEDLRVSCFLKSIFCFSRLFVVHVFHKKG